MQTTLKKIAEIINACIPLKEFPVEIQVSRKAHEDMLDKLEAIPMDRSRFEFVQLTAHGLRLVKNDALDGYKGLLVYNTGRVELLDLAPKNGD